MTVETRSIYSGPIRRALESLERKVAEGGGGGGATGPAGPPGPPGVVQAVVAGANVTVDSSNAAYPIVASTGGGAGTDEVWVGLTDPITTNPTIELWFDPDAVAVAPVSAGAGMTMTDTTLDVVAANGSVTVGADDIQVSYAGTGAAVTAARSDHNHDATYSLTTHNHSGVYAPVVHNHDSAYSAITHNHDTAYTTKAYVDAEVAKIVIVSASDPIAANPTCEMWYQP